MTNETNDPTFYGKREAKIISGIAILMMMTHHFFGFPEYLLPEIHWTSMFSVAGIEVERMFAAFGKLCVGIFAFCSGYAIWKFQSQYRSPKGILTRLSRFLLSYWVILALFLLVGYATNSQMPTRSELLNNLVGLATGPQSMFPYINVPFAWYVSFYCVLLLLSPALLCAFNLPHVNTFGSVSTKKALVADMLIFAALVTLFSIRNNAFLQPIPPSLVGLLACKYQLLERLHKAVGRRESVVLALVILTLVALMRQTLILFKMPAMGLCDGAFAFLFVYSAVIIIKKIHSVFFNNLFIFLGAHSMNLWFLHGIFFTGGGTRLQAALYFPTYAILILIWGVVILLPVSYLCSLAQSKLLQLLHIKH